VARSTTGGPSGTKGLGADVRARIGARLKAYYDEVVSQPVPDRFTELLSRLEDEEQKAPANAKADADE